MASCRTMLVHVFLPSRPEPVRAFKQTETVGDEALIDASGRCGLKADRREKARIKYGRPCSHPLLSYSHAGFALDPDYHKHGSNCNLIQGNPTENCRKEADNFRDATAPQQSQSQRWRIHPQNCPPRRRRFLRARNQSHTLSQTGSAPNSHPSFHHSSSAPQLSTTNTMTIHLLWTLLAW